MSLAPQMILTPMTIEQLWHALRGAAGETVQRRVDAQHPLDLYVDFEPPDRPGLVAVCPRQPPNIRALRAVTVESGRRGDGRWTLRLSLDVPALLPVFAALCRDIIEFTRSGVTEDRLAAAVVARVEHWRNLLEKDASGLGENALRGLIGELSVLETILDVQSPAAAIAAWTGPLGSPQDFLLPSGHRIEVKAARRDARTVRIHGLRQLDPGDDTMDLAIVRMEDTGPGADGAVSAPTLIDRIYQRIAADPEAVASFSASLSFIGWRDHPGNAELRVRVVGIERYLVDVNFPRLVASTVPSGIEDADYTIVLPLLVPPIDAGRAE
jgi:hypothetical protein